MNRNRNLRPFWLLVLLLLPAPARGYILFETASTSATLPVVYSHALSEQSKALVRSLERITGLELEVQAGFLRERQPAPPPLQYASASMRYLVEQSAYFQKYSPTARNLLRAAIRSINVYKVRENRAASLGRVDTSQIIELDYHDLDRVTFRDVPRDAFDAGMIFFHELAHRHLRLRDPSPEELKHDRYAKGATVEFINRIEQELRLPERRHYAPVPIRRLKQDISWGIYFGSGSDRIEFDRGFVVR